MDPNLVDLSTATVATLAPFLPYLLNAAQFTAEAIGEMVVQNGGQKVWQRAQSMWRAIHNRYRDDGVITGMATAVAAAPENTTIQQTLAVQLAQRLAENPDLVRELLDLFEGQEIVQEVLAERGSWVEKVRQEIEGGVGVQKVQATDQSTIIGVTQRIKR